MDITFLPHIPYHEYNYVNGPAINEGYCLYLVREVIKSDTFGIIDKKKIIYKRKPLIGNFPEYPKPSSKC